MNFCVVSYKVCAGSVHRMYSSQASSPWFPISLQKALKCCLYFYSNLFNLRLSLGQMGFTFVVLPSSSDSPLPAVLLWEALGTTLTDGALNTTSMQSITTTPAARGPLPLLKLTQQGHHRPMTSGNLYF